MSHSEFEPRRFRSTVPYYARFRLHYPPELIARVITTAGLAPGDGVMDMGCGPGLLAIPFAEAGMRVTGIEPEPDMLDAARETAREAGVKPTFGKEAPSTCRRIWGRSIWSPWAAPSTGWIAWRR